MIRAREQRLKVLEALDTAVKQFRARKDLYPLRVPHEPVPLDTIIGQSLGEAAGTFELEAIRSRTLLGLEWEDGSAWQVWVATLPSGIRLFCDSGEDGSHAIASGGRNAGDESDRLFLELLAFSRGADFGLELSGGAPTRVRSSLTDRPFLAGIFVELFEGTEAEDEIRAGSHDSEDRLDGRDAAPGRDFQHEVERWLERAFPRSGGEAGGNRESPRHRNESW